MGAEQRPRRGWAKICSANIYSALDGGLEEQGLKFRFGLKEEEMNGAEQSCACSALLPAVTDLKVTRWLFAFQNGIGSAWFWGGPLGFVLPTPLLLQRRVWAVLE